MSKEMNSFLSIVSDMLITKVIDRSVKMTIMSVSYVFSNLRNKDISITQTNHLQFPDLKYQGKKFRITNSTEKVADSNCYILK